MLRRGRRRGRPVSDFHVRFDAKLHGMNVARIVRLECGTLRVEINIRNVTRDMVPLAWVAPDPSKPLPEGRTVPALSRISGDTWRVEAFDWSKRHPKMPRVASFVVTGCPDEWPTPTDLL